jgi:hypothetical protein
MKLIINKQTSNSYYKNKFKITINFYDDETGGEELEIYLDNYRYINEPTYTAELHNLIEALDEVILVDEKRGGSSRGTLENLYSDYKIIRYIDSYGKNLDSDFHIDLSPNQFTDMYVPFETYEINYLDNDGISWDVTIDKS